MSVALAVASCVDERVDEDGVFLQLGLVGVLGVDVADRALAAEPARQDHDAGEVARFGFRCPGPNRIGSSFEPGFGYSFSQDPYPKHISCNIGAKWQAKSSYRL